MNPDNVLITGAKGQLGYEFSRLFESAGVSYTATDCEELNITDVNKVDRCIGSGDYRYIINCAAYNDVDGAEDDRDNCFLLNAKAPEYLAKAAKKIGAIFVTYSTDFVFDGNKDKPYTENDKPGPLSVYAKSKLEGENRVLSAYDRVFIIRTSWLFGIAGKNFNTQVLGWAERNAELRIVDDQISSPTYARDLAFFTWLLIQTEKYGLYHFSNEGQASKFDQALYLLNQASWKGVLLRAKTGDFALKAPRPLYSKLDSSKIKGILGKGIPSWQSGIDRWYEEWKRIRNTVQ